ncbi:DsbA family oxidoreductase [Acinetobacter silvestris]|uniref:Disulfide bond formation protein DsbA n=1 Tax=Acinetobacter silvestris TaxID=1977882 RepID=A0A1Y3CAV9_9GAMM|nr:DsbA family oxidoreductase [Acinetobacter silvestris]OTG64198.1 disulfide bond formation protein DsbA [Acinetobacter silvestris]
MKRKLNIDVFFDFICPWCLIGKRQLQAAINQLHRSDPDVEVKLLWHGVQLIPQLPVEGVPFQAFYLKRLGSATSVRMRQAQVRQAANTVGVDIDFDRIKRMPNTAKAHHLLENALKIGHPEQCDLLLERLFAAYFHHSEDIGDTAVLLKIAEFCGFSAEILGNGLDEPFISADTGGNGVPYFIFDGCSALAGAHPAEVLYKTMLDVLATQGLVT